MPRTFDSFERVQMVARFLSLREPLQNETLEDYRCFVADRDPDKVEAMELRTGRGWDKFTEKDKTDLLRSL